jgi:hypothetical protein
VILGDLPAMWTSLDANGKQAWVQVLFQKLVINDRGKVVDRLLNHPFDEILGFTKGRSFFELGLAQPAPPQPDGTQSHPRFRG